MGNFFIFFVNFLRVYLVLSNILNILWHTLCCCPVFHSCQWPNNVEIWSHCYLPNYLIYLLISFCRCPFIFIYFCLFKQTFQIFTTNRCEKCPSSRYTYGAGIRTHNLRSLGLIPLPLDQGSFPSSSSSSDFVFSVWLCSTNLAFSGFFLLRLGEENAKICFSGGNFFFSNQDFYLPPLLYFLCLSSLSSEMYFIYFN